jgi:hypothetical protein
MADIVAVVIIDYVTGNLQLIEQNTILYLGPNRLIHSVSTDECGDTVTFFGIIRPFMIRRCLTPGMSPSHVFLL